MTNLVYSFGGGKADGDLSMKPVLGGKGAGLAEMTNLGLPVPPGFTIPSTVCMDFVRNGRYPEGLHEAVNAAIGKMEALEAMAGRRFGDEENPLLVSVRSGARESMPGMMDTVLNLGLNEKTLRGFAKAQESEWTAWDCYRRFISMYGDVVLEMKPLTQEDIDPFDQILDEKKAAVGVSRDNELSVADLQDLVRRYKALVLKRTGKPFPDDPMDQLWGAIDAVFQSWNNPRAIAYRQYYRIPDDWGTAVNVQAMVFGNAGENSGTGVCFTRDSATGEKGLTGDFFANGQGEDVVAGKVTAPPIQTLNASMPDVYQQLLEITDRLEQHYRDMQDIEFTIERGRLFVLQTRSGKRTGFSAARIAVEMVEEGLITSDEALLRIDPEAMEQFLAPLFDQQAKKAAVAEGRYLTRGLPAGPGAASGKIVFFADDAEEWKRRGEQVVLTRHETSPDDVHGMKAAEGFLTAFGGMSSHAALVARQMGKVAVVGCSTLSFDYSARTLTVKTDSGARVFHEGDWISLDGFTGEVLEGQLKASPSEVVRALVDGDVEAKNAPLYRRFAQIMRWADEARTLKVRANADQPDQARAAVALGGEGIGLCRTEHMFFGPGKIEAVQRMIVATTEKERRAALDTLLPLQREDFAGLFRAMEGRPVTVRTLDPPLHEFLPHDEEGIQALSQELGIPAPELKARIQSLDESNPMLGHRGCRLGITYPEITEMQARAIFEAACDVVEEGGVAKPEVMVPLVGHVKELELQGGLVRRVAEEVIAARGVELEYQVGTMIEVPRGALTAGEIAKVAEFFSFGTNDLTQTCFGLSRDDVPRVLETYISERIYSVDPFVSVDQAGVGRLMEIAVHDGRETVPNLKIGICGEHGGDPQSVEYCHGLGLNYVSCSPYRIPVARVAAGQAALKAKQ
jgi:pyruvate,orthophosphate dikinase